MNRNFGKRIVLANGPMNPSSMTEDSFRAFQYRMSAGFPGDVNRTHPASIVPHLIDATNPPLYYGQCVVINPATGTVRGLLATDTALTAVFGITVRPYPMQQITGTPNALTAQFGSQTPPAPPLGGAIDVLKSGFIMVPVYGPTVLGGPVFVWVAASTGNHIQGLFEGATSASTISLTENSGAAATTYYNGAPDASAMINTNINVVELAFNA